MTGKKDKQDAKKTKADAATTENKSKDETISNENMPKDTETNETASNNLSADKESSAEATVDNIAADKTENPSDQKPEKDGPQKNQSKNEAIVNKQASETAAPKKGSSSIIVLILLLLIIIGLGVGGYFGWQFWTQYSGAQEQRLQTLETSAAEQNTKISNLSRQQSSQADTQVSLLNEVTKNQEALQQRLDSHTQRLRSLAGTSRDDWLLAEARYLLRLASQRLLVERGTTGAQALLESADKILLSIDDSGVLPVRNAIAQEIIALKLAKSVDREGLYLQISALKNQIQQLPLIPFKPEIGNNAVVEDKIETQTDTETPWYQSIWKSIKNGINSLGRFIEVNDNYYDQAPELLISTETKLQIVNNLTLMFEQAQFALLHEEEVIYKTSLEQAKKWWKNYYSHYNEYEVVHSEITKLQGKNIIQVLPNINRSSELLTDYIEQFHRLNNPQAITRPPASENNLDKSDSNRNSSANNAEKKQEEPKTLEQSKTEAEPIEALPKTQEPQS